MGDEGDVREEFHAWLPFRCGLLGNKGLVRRVIMMWIEMVLCWTTGGVSPEIDRRALGFQVRQHSGPAGRWRFSFWFSFASTGDLRACVLLARDLPAHRGRD